MNKEAIKLALEAHPFEDKSVISALSWAAGLIEQAYRGCGGHNGADSWLMNYADKQGERIRQADHREWEKVNGRWQVKAPVQEPALQPAGLSDAVYTVLEGFTLPHDVRKILETAFYGPAATPQPAQQEPDDKRVIELATRYGLDHSMIGALRNFADAYHGQSLSWQKIELSEDQLQRLTTKASFIPGLVTGTSSQPAQQQEPVARIAELEETVRHLNHALREATEAPTFMGEPVSAEPAASIKGVDEYGPMLNWYTHWVNFPVGTRLYTSPPAQRTWVGLTDEEIDKTYETKVWDARRSYARAIEAKLKEKNA